MATTSTVPDVLDYLQEQLSRRSGLAGVQVSSIPLPMNDTALESIQFDSTFDQTQWSAIGNMRRDETSDIRGYVYIEKAGNGEVVGRQARRRAYQIVAEIEQFLLDDHKLGGLIVNALVGEQDLDQGVSAAGRRVARISFTVRVRASLSRT